MPATARPTAEQLCSSPREPDRNCQLCPRLAAFRDAQRVTTPDWFNAPVPSFGVDSPALIIVGLAPGLKGANRTGRPFTGDYAGDLLYATLLEFGFASGTYAAHPGDGLRLEGCLITNSVRCVPPQNKPTPAEIKSCNPFLAATLQGNASTRAIVALGRVAHDGVLSALGLRKALFAFKHGAAHAIAPALTLFDSFHCSRYNTNTRVLTPEMFRDVFRNVREYLK